MRVVLFKHSESSFLQGLDDAEIEYQKQAPTFNNVMASGTMIVVAQVAAASGSVAAIIVAWIKARASRKVIFTLNDQRVIHLEGYTVAQVKELLPIVSLATVIQIEPEEI